jgi:hypothetical protein
MFLALLCGVEKSGAAFRQHEQTVSGLPLVSDYRIGSESPQGSSRQN